MKESGPSKPGFGVYVNVPLGFITRVPLVGLVLEVTVKLFPSGSVSLVNTFPLTGVSIGVLTASSFATTSFVMFVGFTYIVTVAVSQAAVGVTSSQIV